MSKNARVTLLVISLCLIAGIYSYAQTSGSVTAGNWYRIASNSGDRANAEFTLRDFISSGGHSSVTFRAGISFNDQPGISFTLINHSYYKQVTFTKIRILDMSTYDPQYLEVYVERSGSVNFSIYDNLHNSGWQEIAWTAGAIPSGYTSTEFSINNLFVVGSQGNKLTVNRDGRIGIGTSNPVSKLHIAHSAQSDGVKIETTGSDANTSKLQILYNYNGTSADRNAAIELGRDVDNSGSYKWRLLANSGFTWGNMPTFSIQNLIGGVYNTRFYISNDGNIGIGTTTPEYKLDVQGTIRANEVKVTSSGADFVFEPDYNLPTLEEVENYINQNGHLPDIPSAEVVKADGISLGEMNTKLLQKIEELTLYVIEQNKKLEAQSLKLEGVVKENDELKALNLELKEKNQSLNIDLLKEIEAIKTQLK